MHKFLSCLEHLTLCKLAQIFLKYQAHGILVYVEHLILIKPFASTITLLDKVPLFILKQNHNHLKFYKMFMLSKNLKQGNSGNLGLMSGRTLMGIISRTP